MEGIDELFPLWSDWYFLCACAETMTNFTAYTQDMQEMDEVEVRKKESSVVGGQFSKQKVIFGASRKTVIVFVSVRTTLICERIPI